MTTREGLAVGGRCCRMKRGEGYLAIGGVVGGLSGPGLSRACRGLVEQESDEIDEGVVSRGFVHDGSDAVFFCFFVQSVERVEGVEENWYVRMGLRNHIGGTQSVYFGHQEIEDDEVGLVVGGGFDRFRAVGNLRTDVPIGIRFEARPESAAHKNMVVGDQNAKRQESLQVVSFDTLHKNRSGVNQAKYQVAEGVSIRMDTILNPVKAGFERDFGRWPSR